jgi:hypothetical protein
MPPTCAAAPPTNVSQNSKVKMRDVFFISVANGCMFCGIKALYQFPTGKHTQGSQNVRKNF